MLKKILLIVAISTPYLHAKQGDILDTSKLFNYLDNKRPEPQRRYEISLSGRINAFSGEMSVHRPHPSRWYFPFLTLLYNEDTSNINKQHSFGLTAGVNAQYKNKYILTPFVKAFGGYRYWEEQRKEQKTGEGRLLVGGQMGVEFELAKHVFLQLAREVTYGFTKGSFSYSKARPKEGRLEFTNWSRFIFQL